MKFTYREMGFILQFDSGYVNELIIENKKMFFSLVNDLFAQSDGESGGCVLSISERPVDISKYADITVQFAPFQINRKSLLTKLYSALEKRAVQAENYIKSEEMLSEIEKYILYLGEELPFEINCQKLSITSIIKAVAPEIDEADKSPLERIFSYMELVRELDRDRLFIMINMRSYFSDEDMEIFIESVCLHDFKVLLIESISSPLLKNVKRYTVDEDLCEF